MCDYVMYFSLGDLRGSIDSACGSAMACSVATLETKLNALNTH